jgi:hypothetical protein
MDCQKAEEMINCYINRTLSVEELEEFLNHISTCTSCYDELETHFIVHEAMRQLDDDEEETTLDFHQLLDMDLDRSQHYIFRKRSMQTWQFTGFFLGLILLAAFIILVILK